MVSVEKQTQTMLRCRALRNQVILGALSSTAQGSDEEVEDPRTTGQDQTRSSHSSCAYRSTAVLEVRSIVQDAH